MKPRFVCTLLLTLACACSASATVTFSLTIIRETKPAYDSSYGQTWYYAYPSLSDSTPPLSHHRVESPTDICSANFGTNTGAGCYVFNSADQLLGLLTNGNWKLWLNRDTPEEQLYSFTLATDSIASNSFGAVQITSPVNGALNVASNTTYQWTGPEGFDSINVEVQNALSATLSANETNWLAGPMLDPGTNFFSVNYFHNAISNYMVSIPTNDTLGSLTNWAVSFISLESAAKVGFISEGLTPTPLATALDAPGLIWQTGGDAGWFSQIFLTHDGEDAARSGPISDGESTTLRTVIYGTNSITFWWKVDCEAQADYIEFTDNGTYVDDLTGASGWQQFIYNLADGNIHVLEWTYYKDSALAEGIDGAFLDRVSLLGQPTISVGEPLTFALNIHRKQLGTFNELGTNQTRFYALPSLAAPTNPISYHRVESPNAFCSANLGTTNGGSSSDYTLNFDDLAGELTNGNWKVWLNKETPEEQFHMFKLTALSFNSNDLGEITITAPIDGATNALVHSPFEWTGPPGWADLFLEARQLRYGTNHQYALATPSSDTTIWADGPALDPGTNCFSVRYQKPANTNFALSTPFLNWTVGNITFESSADSGFIVTAATPVQLVSPQQIGLDFQFTFMSEFGRSNLVQSCTDLTLGWWQDRTNLLGDGTLKTILLPISSEPTEFFRVLAQ